MRGRRPTPDQIDQALRDYGELRIQEDELIKHYKEAALIGKFSILRRLRGIVMKLTTARNIIERAGKLNKTI